MLLDSRDRLDPLLALALRAGLGEVVTRELRRLAHVDARDSMGRTALMIAAEFGHVEICRLLLFAGADPALRDASGSTASEIAREHGHAMPLEMPAGVPDDAGQQASLEPPTSVVDEAPCWEPNDEEFPPEDDFLCRLSSEELQRQIGAQMPKDNDRDWSDIAFELPPEEPLRSISAPMVSRLILEGLSSGRIHPEEIEAACTADFNEDADAVLPCLTRLLEEDLGLVIEDMHLDKLPACGRVEPGNEWLVPEILQSLADALPQQSRSDYFRYVALLDNANNDFLDGREGGASPLGMHTTQSGFFSFSADQIESRSANSPHD
ncbi:ankyrin repeat domain-containing protein [Cupriavidus pinatubonensis]|uniref:ankyrin repeat domain-containing protein n=1 Tax=Cupriavidus pinatubonensis TaxID=248026 RepID=UPI001C73A2FC|nr:ankyrin repeat domain-containing protein [Cupriavidus pinatubonensis]QYY31645.1 ankyrin repeat domain-containing protein [Cupriavidus pinatubonensis]